mmetsp:Transcript_19114/g.24798  ORF Transcript_19114/g.24798 Transcript_19114/m.24798 type:complete len:159 (-) Transcript_19114:965-1441(-)
MTKEWCTENEDERFLPTLQDDASEIIDGLWLGSEANALDLVWLKVQGIRTIITINSRRTDPLSMPEISESLKQWFRTNVNHVYYQALDTPTQMVLHLFQPAYELIHEVLDAKENILVHCGRGISRSATLVIAALMTRESSSYCAAYVIFFSPFVKSWF